MNYCLTDRHLGYFLYFPVLAMKFGVLHMLVQPCTGKLNTSSSLSFFLLNLRPGWAKFLILLLQIPKFWDYMSVLSYLAF